MWNPTESWVSKILPDDFFLSEEIEYLQEENKVLQERFKGKRPRLTDAQHRYLAVKAKKLERKAPRGRDAIVTPDIFLG